MENPWKIPSKMVTYMGDPLIAGWFIMEKLIKMDDMYTYIYSADILYLFIRLYTYVISTVTPSQAAYKATYPRAVLFFQDI